MAHFHHFSMCNQNQSISILVIFGQNTKAIALLFGQKLAHFHHFSMCNQNQSISILVIFGQNTKAIALLFGQKLAHFHKFSMCNQNQSISILVIFGNQSMSNFAIIGLSSLGMVEFINYRLGCQWKYCRWNGMSLMR